MNVITFNFRQFQYLKYFRIRYPEWNIPLNPLSLKFKSSISKMKPSNSAHELHKMINKAIEDHKITREEYDLILNIATEDGHIDRQEQALLEQLQEMIENKMVRFVHK